MERDWNKYVVFKKSDLDIVLSYNPILKNHFETIVNLINIRRMTLNKKVYNSYVVVNMDEPYAEEVWKLIEDDLKNK